MSKKTSKAAPREVSSYAQRDIVLGKVRGFPPWPGMVVDPDSVPEAVQAERPAKKANFYCVQFFPAGDYAWLVAKDISKLQTHEIESYINEPYKKSGDLLQGYRTALDPTAWEASRAATLAALAAAAASSASASAEDEDAEAEAEAEAEGEAADEVDELDTDREGGDAGKKKKGKTQTRKRKRESDVGAGAGGKTRKPPKEKKERKEKKKNAAPVKPRRSGAKTKALVESEDEHGREEEEGEGTEDAEGEDAGPSKKTSPPPAKKARRDRAADKDKEEDPEDAKMQADPEALKVREWRHRLQKAFLSSKTTPEDADMPALDVLFSTVESYHAITVAYLQFSKIGKVMRHITLLTEDRVPRDAEFRFRERARALVERWQLVLGAGRGGESAAAKMAPGENGKEVVNGKELKEEVKEETKVNGMGLGVGAGGPPTQDTKEVTAGAAAIDLNGRVDGAGAGLMPADVDAQGEADAQGQADAQGEVDAPAEVDVAMAEA